MQLKKRPKTSHFIRWATLLLSLSLVLNSAQVGERAPAQATLAPSHQPFTHLEEPLTSSFLNEAALSEDLDERALAQTILSDQKKWSGLVFAFAAAFISALAITGQEVILKNVFIFHYLLLEPILMSLIFVAMLLIFKKAKTPGILLSFFKTLRESETRGWFVASLLLAQMLLPLLFFFTLPLIGATSMNMIAALTLFFTLFFEWILLGENKFQRRHFLAFFLLFWGVVGFKITSATLMVWIGLGVLIYFVASAENVIRKKIVENIGAEARTNSFTLSFLIWNKLFSFGFWFSSLMMFGLYSGGNPITVSLGGELSLLGLLSSPLLFVVLITSAFLASASFLEQKTRTIKQFPVSILEAVRQTQVIFTAMIATFLVFLSSNISIPAISNITSTTLSQWLFIPVILSGVALLSYFQREEELKAEKKNGNQVIHPDGMKITKGDWLLMLAKMNESSNLVQPADRAKNIWNNYKTHRKETLVSEPEEPLSEAEIYWADEISQFTSNERLIFKRAKEIKGMRIGFDLDGTIIPDFEDYTVLEFERLKEKPYVDSAVKRYRERVLLRPGMKPLILGLMANNYVEIDTAGTQNHVDTISDYIPFIKRLVDFPSFEVKVRKDMLQALNGFIDFKEVTLFGKKKVVVGDWMLNGMEMIQLYRDKKRIKLPVQLGLDVLIDNNPYLQKFLTHIRYSSRKRIITVRTFELKKETRYPFRLLGSLVFFYYGRLDEEEKTVYFSTDSEYEEKILSILPVLEELKVMESNRKRVIAQDYFFQIEEAV